jgi:hypothetical protein
MTTRCAFLPSGSGDFFEEKLVEFKYENGLAPSQRYKSAANLRNSAQEQFPDQKGLEVSRYSDNPLGVALSAFNLEITIPDIGKIAVENLFQSSKVFEKGGPYRDLVKVSPFDAKKDSRIKNSGNLLEFRFKVEIWPLESGTDFYDFYYLRALIQNPKLFQDLLTYDYFTDIACNKTALGYQKGKTFSTQARSCAIAVGLSRAKLLEQALSSQETYWATVNRELGPAGGPESDQPTLF